MYNNSLHRERKHFCRYFLQAFCIEKIVKSHIKDCFKINGKQKNYERKIKSPFIFYADIESNLKPKNNRKQNPEGSYINKYQKYIACSY